MLNRLTDSESLALRGVVLGGLLLWGSQNLTEKPYQPSGQAFRSAETDLVDSQSNDQGLTDLREAFRQIFSTELTPREEAEVCNELLSEARSIDAQVEPESYVDSIGTYRACLEGVSPEAKGYLETPSFDLEQKYHFLLRCTEQGDDFRVADLDACEEKEYEYAEEMMEVVSRWGLDYEFRDFENFTPWQVDKGVDLMNPGPSFIVTSADGAYEATFQFNVTVHGTNGLDLDPNLIPTSYEGDPGALQLIYRPLESDDKLTTARKFFWAAKRIQSLGAVSEE